MKINDPDVLKEVTEQFYRYEKALMENDVETLNILFWDTPHTIRYGPKEALYGYEEISGFRAARDVSDIARELTRTVITTYGDDFATAFTEYKRVKSGADGRQTQTCTN